MKKIERFQVLFVSDVQYVLYGKFRLFILLDVVFFFVLFRTFVLPKSIGVTSLNS